MSLENREKTTRKLISHREYYRESFADMFSWSTNQFLNISMFICLETTYVKSLKLNELASLLFFLLELVCLAGQWTCRQL